MNKDVQRSITYVLTIFIGLHVSATAFFGTISGSTAEWCVTAIVWGIFLNIFRQTNRKERIEMLTVLAFATPMELFFSEVWLIYEYQRGFMPWFVPAGHYFLFDLGRICTRAIHQNIQIIGLIPLIPFILYGFVEGSDTSALLLLGFVILFIKFGPASKLYVVMVWLALFMELWGTFLGNWTWAHQVPGTPFTAWNPPLLVGAFYCLGDLLVVSSVAKFQNEPTAGVGQ